MGDEAKGPIQAPGQDRQTRREFCVRGCRMLSVAALGGALGSMLEGCSTGNPAGGASGAALPIVSATVSGNSVVLTIDSTSPLATVGGAALVQAPGALVLVARTAQDTFSALSAICTHQACTITDFGNQMFLCPCHGSLFSMTGAVLSGPAAAPLRRYQTQFANNVLTISA